VRCLITLGALTARYGFRHADGWEGAERALVKNVAAIQGEAEWLIRAGRFGADAEVMISSLEAH
jgi:hypothetical protein